MPLTVETLLQNRRLGLRLVGGSSGAGRAITWAHAIELEDPTPWLSGGELVMTTGLRLADDPAGQGEYVRRLSAKGATALAIDTGTVHPAVPEAVRREGDVCGFPVLAVAQEVPFIAIGRAVANALTADQVAASARVAEQQQRLARAALVGGISAVGEALAQSLGADVLVLDAQDTVLASAGRNWTDERTRSLMARAHRGRRSTRSSAVVDDGGQVISQSLGVAGVVRGQVLVATTDPLQANERLLISHAVALISLELEKPSEVLTVERKLRAGVFRALLSGVLDDDVGQLRYFGFAPESMVVALVLTDVGPLLPAEQLLDQVLADAGSAYLSMASEEALIVLLPATSRDQLPEHVYTSLRKGLQRSISGGIGRPAPVVAAVQSQRQALAAARAGRIEGRRLLSFDQLGTYDLLLGGQSREALEAVSSASLGPLERYDEERKGDLVRSLEVFLAHNGQWEAAAAGAAVHRHTMRNRINKVSELLGKDVESAHVRGELWLAIKARELLQLGP